MLAYADTAVGAGPTASTQAWFAAAGASAMILKRAPSLRHKTHLSRFS